MVSSAPCAVAALGFAGLELAALEGESGGPVADQKAGRKLERQVRRRAKDVVGRKAHIVGETAARARRAHDLRSGALEQFALDELIGVAVGLECVALELDAQLG